jgi:hypothetical protein
MLEESGEKHRFLHGKQRNSLVTMPHESAEAVAQMLHPRKAYRSGRTPVPLLNFGSATTSRRFWTKITGVLETNEDGDGGINVNTMNMAASDLVGCIPSGSTSTYLGQGQWPLPTSGSKSSNSPYTAANLNDADVMLLACGLYIKDAGPLYTRGGSTACAINDTLDKDLRGAATATTITPEQLRLYSPGSVIVDSMNEPAPPLLDEEGWYRDVWLPGQWGATMAVEDNETVINGAYYGGVPLAGSLWGTTGIWAHNMARSLTGVDGIRTFEYEIYAAFDVRGYVPVIPQLISNKHEVSAKHKSTVKQVTDSVKSNRGEGIAKGLFKGTTGFLENSLSNILPALGSIGQALMPMAGNMLMGGLAPSTGTPLKAMTGGPTSRMYDPAAAARGEMPLIEEVFEDSFLNAALEGGGESVLLDALPLLALV